MHVQNLQAARDTAVEDYVNGQIAQAVAAAGAERDAIARQLATMTADRDAIARQLTDANARLATSTSTISTLNAEIARLRALLAAAPDPADLPGWGLPAWRDEFTGPTVDTAKWRVRNNESLSYDKARILAGNVNIKDGRLAITAKKETASDGRAFTTGYLDTIGKHSQRYGRWEIRAKVPTLLNQSRGLWPAFWLRCDSTAGEIDILEAWGHPRVQQEQFAGMSHIVCHEKTDGTGQKKELVWENELRKLTGQTLPQVGADFHTWAIEFTPQHMKGFYDGELVFTHTPATVPWLWGSTFTSPLNMRLNLQVGQNYHGHPVAPYTDTVTPADFLVDYVRVWALPA